MKEFSGVKRGDQLNRKIKDIQTQIDKELKPAPLPKKKDKQTRDITLAVKDTKSFLQTIRKKYQVKNLEQAFLPQSVPGVIQDKSKRIIRRQIRGKEEGVVASHDLKDLMGVEARLDIDRLLAEEQKAIVLEGVEEEWMNAETLLDDFSQYSFAGRGPIRPSPRVYDRWAANALLLVRASKRLFDYLVVTQLYDNRVCAFRFHQGASRPVSVLTNSLLPVYQAATGEHRPAFSHALPIYNETWLQLALKAYCRFVGGKEQLVGLSFAESVFHMTGRTPEVIPFSQAKRLHSDAFQRIAFLMESGAVVAFLACNDCSPSQPPENQLFIVQQAGKAVVRLQNGWASSSDSGEGEGPTMLNYDQLHQQFNRLVVLADRRPDQESTVSVPLSFYSLGIPSSSQNEPLSKGLQVVFRLKEPMKVTINLIRCSLTDRGFGFYLFELTEKQTKINSVNLDRLKKVVTLEQGQLQACCATLDLPKGRFTFAPFSSCVSTQAYQHFELEVTVGSEKLAKKSFLFEKMRYRDFEYSSTGKLESTEAFEDVKPKQVKFDVQSSFGREPQLDPSWKAIVGILVPLRAGPFLGQECPCPRPKKEKQEEEDSRGLKEDQLLELLFEEAGSDEILTGLDLGYMGLGLSLRKLLPAIARLPELTELSLRENELEDELVVDLCRLLEENAHYEMRQLDLRGNGIGSAGSRAIRFLKEKFGDLQVLVD